MFLQETFVVWDTLFYDDGISGTASYSTGSAVTKEIGDEYTTFSTLTSNSTTGRITSTTSFTGDIECLLQCNITYESQVGVYVGFRSSNPTSWRINVTDWRYIKFRRVNGVYSAQISTDGVNWSDMTPYDNNAGSGAVTFYLLIYNPTGVKKTFDFKELLIYSV